MSDVPALSIVITCYNRAHLIGKAIDSCFAEFAGHPHFEVVVVDDASTDSSAETVRKKYSESIRLNQIRITELHKNRGVSGAKNAGYESARNKWVMFLDSDDYLVSGSGPAILSELSKFEKSPIVFFRCVDQEGRFVGRQFSESIYLDLKTYIRSTSFGEAIGAFNKSLEPDQVPYIEKLRGYEGLGCARRIQKFGSAVLSHVIARVYDQTSNERLSVSHGFMKRVVLIGQGHLMMLSEFSSAMDSKQKVMMTVKAIVFILVGSIYNMAARLLLPRNV